MKTPLKTYLSILFLAVAIIFSGCKGEDGDPGPVGETGAQGEKGDAGDKGDKGDKGEGFDEAVSKGNIVVVLDGTRPDGVAFQQTLDFRFAPTDLDYSSIYADDDERYSDVKRYLGFDGTAYDGEGPDYVNSYVYLWDGNYKDENAKDVYYSDMHLKAPIVFPTEHKYFELTNFNDWDTYSSWFETYYVQDESSNWVLTYDGNVTDPVVTEYEYANATGSLKYKLSYTIPAVYNSSGYDLKVTVTVDASVYEELYSELTLDRTSKTGRAAQAPKKVAKAEMKDLQ